jgi:hypothetical protein
MPKKTKKAKKVAATRTGLSCELIPLHVALRWSVRESGMTHYAIGKAAEVAPSVIDRFMLPDIDPRHRDIRLETASKIAAVLGLVLVHPMLDDA